MSIFILIPEKGNAKESSNYRTIALISRASEVMLKNYPSQASIVRELRTSRCSSWIQKRQRKPQIKLPTSIGSQKKQENSRKPSKHLKEYEWRTQVYCTHFTCQQSKAQNSPSQASTVRELRTSRCSSQIQKRQRIKLPTSVGPQKKWENSRKTSTSASLTTLKPLTVWITTNCGKFLKRQEYQTTLAAS